MSEKTYQIDSPCTHGFLIVKLDGKYGFIDPERNLICEIKYDFVHTFYEGFARVELNGKYGFIDGTGKEICEIKYDEADWKFTDGYAKVKADDKILYLDTQGREYNHKPI